MRFVLLAFALFYAAPVAAQTAIPCGWQARADAIVEPWAENTATFANGAVRVALRDTIEPAACAAYLLITHPPLDEVGGRTCTFIGLDDDLGDSLGDNVGDNLDDSLGDNLDDNLGEKLDD